MKRSVISLIAAVLSLVGAAHVVQAQSTNTPVVAQRVRRAPPPAARKLTPDQIARAQWQQKMSASPNPLGGCATVVYPSTVWTATPCVARSDGPVGRPPQVGSGKIVPLEVSGNDLVASVTGTMTYASGSFYTGGITGEVSSGGDTTPNTWGIQINANTFTGTGCQGSGCRGWQQFVYATSPASTVAYMQYWLIGYVAPPGQTTQCPDKTWNFASGGKGAAPGCWKNSPGIANPPVVPITGLNELSLTGVITPNGQHYMNLAYNGAIYQIPPQNDVVGLATQWRQAEFNIFGFQTLNGQTPDVANLNPGTGGAVVSVSVKVNGNPGQMGAISCVIGGTTAETNSLNLSFSNLTPQDECYDGFVNGWSQIDFNESNGPTVTRVSPANGPQGGGTSVDVFGTGFIPTTLANSSIANGTEIAFGSTYQGATCDSTTHCKVGTPATPTAGPVLVSAVNSTSLATSVPGNSSALFTFVAPPPSGTLTPIASMGPGGTTVEADLTSVSASAPSAFRFDFGSGPVMIDNAVCKTSALNPANSYCTFTTPSVPAGIALPVAVPVSVAAAGATLPLGTFTYQAPSPGSISPVTGPRTGGTKVTVHANNFVATSDAVVRFAFNGVVMAAPNSSCTVDSGGASSTCTATTPPLPADEDTPVVVPVSVSAHGHTVTVASFRYGTKRVPVVPPCAECRANGGFCSIRNGHAVCTGQMSRPR